MAARELGIHMASPVFDGANEEDVWSTMEEAGMDRDGKTILYDGRSGEPFDNRVSVGVMYLIKLDHMVDDKFMLVQQVHTHLLRNNHLAVKHSLVDSVSERWKFGRLKLMVQLIHLQEILTVKSDDVVGRVKTYEAIVKGESVPQPGVPESFKVLIKELQSLGFGR